MISYRSLIVYVRLNHVVTVYASHLLVLN